MNPETQFTFQFGLIALQFSSLEFAIAQILDRLIDRDDEVVGGLMTGDLPLSKKLAQVRKLAHFRFAPYPEMEQRVQELIKEVDRLRQIRNSFIHGLWQVGPEIANGVIRCHDLQWKSDKGTHHWSRMADKLWTFEELSKIQSELSDIIPKSMQLAEELKTTPMLNSRSHKVKHEAK